jgi:hypothetical protein
MIEDLTKSRSPLVNTIFKISHIVVWVYGIITVGVAWFKMSGATYAMVKTGIGLALWWAALGLYRLWKG